MILYKLGIVKLADFGFAKTLEYGASLAESFCGTLDFIAPERITGILLYIYYIFLLYFLLYSLFSLIFFYDYTKIFNIFHSCIFNNFFFVCFFSNLYLYPPHFCFFSIYYFVPFPFLFLSCLIIFC